jgi:inosine-uridine nucleoside N-ribohydrolase
MAPNKIIIDTDPVSTLRKCGVIMLTFDKGVDDILAMLLAFSAKPEELDILMLSLTFGNVEVQK